jgi:hypothetical protein
MGYLVVGLRRSSGLIRFERSGHAVWSYEPGKFNSLMVNKAPAETYKK